MWETVDLRELRAFLALADELHFGRTAERLRLTPSRVSQAIRSLEKKLGTELVYRTSREVRLTAAGEVFQHEARSAYGRLMDVLERAHNRTERVDGVLRLGLLSAPAAGPRLLAVVDAFTARHPQCRVEVAQIAFPDPMGQLHRGDVDVLATWLPVAHPELATGPLLVEEPRVLAVARDHPLAARGEISIEELADWRVARMEGMDKDQLEIWIPSRTPSGRAIPRHPQSMLPTEVTTLAVRLARGEIVHPTVPSAAAYLGGPEIAYVPITDLPPMRSALVWRRRRRDGRLRAFLAVARDVLS
jgi:DNA-binding transcriptional LysR family regulator